MRTEQLVWPVLELRALTITMVDITIMPGTPLAHTLPTLPTSWIHVWIVTETGAATLV